MALVLLLIIAYIVGSIPTGYLLARVCGIRDIRLHGSGNIGATNVGRLLGVKYFFIVFAFDFFKAYSMICYACTLNFSDITIFFIACALFFGNIASLFLRFQGGRGIATGVGILAAVAPAVLAAICIPWSIVFILTRTVGFASVVGLFALPACAYAITGPGFTTVLALIMTVVGLVRHRHHIMTIMKTVGIA